MTIYTKDYWVHVAYVDGKIERHDNISLNEAWDLKSNYEKILHSKQHNAYNRKHIIKEVTSGRTL